MKIFSKVFAGCILLHLLGAVNSLQSLKIKVPKAVMAGDTVELQCNYDLEGANLYSIKWYWGMQEFYRYVPKESPPTKVFHVPNLYVDISRSDQNRVVLTRLHRSLTGDFTCEVSGDVPLFHTEIQTSQMVVIEPPLVNPSVTSDRLTYIGGDRIKANCTSAPSSPAVNVTWYVNEQMVPGITPSQVTNFSNDLASSLATLDLETAVLSPVPTLMIRCEASIFEVWKSSSNTIVLRERSASPASALERSDASLNGTANITTYSILIVILLHITNKLYTNNLDYSER